MVQAPKGAEPAEQMGMVLAAGVLLRSILDIFSSFSGEFTPGLSIDSID